MNHKSYLGGIWRRCEGGRFTPPPAETIGEDWGWIGERAELFLRGAPAIARLFTWDGLAILLRGYARPRGSSAPLDLERLAEELRCHYLETGELDVDALDGSFTLALCDSQANRVILYRNLIGSGSTYYHTCSEGMLFAGNLAELVELTGSAALPNRDALPSFFLFRCVPGRETLFADHFRLLPGEELIWDQRGLTRRQRHTFADLIDNPIPEVIAVEQLDAVMATILADGRSLRPSACNLLSGGVDSSYLQAIWNSAIWPKPRLPTSYSICVDHPHTWPDTDYAMTASRMLGTVHRLIPADAPYETYLLDTLETTAEPLNHVQSAYFGHLARAMAADGVATGICGEGADSLFGVGLANQVHNAQVLRKLLPTRSLRGLAAQITELLGFDRLAHTLRFADRLEDWNWLDHPVNRVAMFADLSAVEACFGRAAILQATEERRSLLDQYKIPNDPLQRMHAVGFLGEAMDSAGLWSTAFHRAGLDLLCPFLDSRMLRFALNLPESVRFRFRRPKDLLKRALTRHAPAELAHRVKLGFGQPIFAWLSRDGQLRRLVDRIGEYAFVDRATLQRVLHKPTWFLSTLLVYDTWHRLFVDREPVQFASAHQRSLAQMRI